ncbi:MAG: hypothetical protein WCI71_10280 [Bacteroidota bacterium]
MARQVINIGIVPGDGRGDQLRIGGAKINDNFAELYGSLQILGSTPVMTGMHDITPDESKHLTLVHELIPAPGSGKIIDLISLTATITPSELPVGGLQVNPAQTLNVTTDGDTETQDWGYFPSLFLMSSVKVTKRMTPVFSTFLYDNQPVYVCLSGGVNPPTGSAQIELYYLYRIIDPSGSGGPLDNGATKQVVQSFTNQTELSIQHNLHKYPTVVVIDSAGRELIPEIVHESTDRMTIRFNPAASGKIIYS